MTDPYSAAERILDVIAEAEAYSARFGLPSVPKEDGLVLEALAFTAAATGARIFADIGAGAGVSSAWIALGASRGCTSRCKLLLIDLDEEPLRYARLVASKASGGRLEVEAIVGDAMRVLQRLRVDFAFIDVDKSLYPALARLLAEQGTGLTVFHNALYPPPPREFYETLDEVADWSLIPTRLGLVVARPRRTSGG